MAHNIVFQNWTPTGFELWRPWRPFFQNGGYSNSECRLSTNNKDRSLILVPISTFAGPRNPNMTLFSRYFVSAILFSNMAAIFVLTLYYSFMLIVRKHKQLELQISSVKRYYSIFCRYCTVLLRFWVNNGENRIFC